MLMEVTEVNICRGVIMAKEVERRQTNFDIEDIARIVSDYYGISPELLKSRTGKRRDLVIRRWIAMYFSKKLTNKSMSYIGSYFGGYDHATVGYGCKEIETMRGQPYYRDTYLAIDAIEKILK